MMYITVNGEQKSTQADPMTPLARVLREEFFLTGTKVACGEGFCGSCLVLLDDRPVMSCLVPIGLARDRSVRTVESLAPDDRPLSPLQQAMEEHDAVQCGMCFPGILMMLTHLFEKDDAPSEADIRAALVGNVCRCTGYARTVEAALSVSGRRQSDNNR